jgi:hypothetical protein
MRKAFLGALGAAILFLSMAPAADAMATGFRVKNQSDKCAWATVYVADGVLSRYEIASFVSPIFKPRFVKAGEEWDPGSFGYGGRKFLEIKFRFEVKKNPDCSGPNIADTYDVNKSNDTGHQATGFLHGNSSNNHYYATAH